MVQESNWNEANSTLIIKTEGSIAPFTEHQLDAVHIRIFGDVKYIENQAFENYRKLETIEFPDSVTGFGNSVIDNSKVKTIHIPLSCNTLSSSGSFDWLTTLEEFTIDDDHAYFRVLDGVLYDKNMTTLFIYPAGKKDTIYSIPYGVKTIWVSSTTGLHYLRHMIIPQTVDEATSLFYTPSLSDSINVTVFRNKDQPDSSLPQKGNWFYRFNYRYYINYVHEEYYATYYANNNTVDIITTGRDHSIFYQDTFFSNFSDIKYVNIGRGIKSLSSYCFSNSTNIVYFYSNEVCTPYLCRTQLSFNFISIFIAMIL